jgi:hypothetical protein
MMPETANVQHQCRRVVTGGLEGMREEEGSGDRGGQGDLLHVRLTGGNVLAQKTPGQAHHCSTLTRRHHAATALRPRSDLGKTCARRMAQPSIRSGLRPGRRLVLSATATRRSRRDQRVHARGQTRLTAALQWGQAR